MLLPSIEITGLAALVDAAVGLALPHDVSQRAFILIAAMALDAWLGEPGWLWRRLPHPVVIFGGAIGYLESRLNRRSRGGQGTSARKVYKARHRRRYGVLAIVLLVLAAVIGGGVVMVLVSLGSGLVAVPIGDVLGGILAHIIMSEEFGSGIGGAFMAYMAEGAIAAIIAAAVATALTMAVQIILVAILLAARSLDAHVRAVADALDGGDLKAARRAIALIVGRNPESLDAAAMARAGIETTAENLSDGVIAPALFYLVGGLPGIVAYKMINTADSMTGYRSRRYLAYGWGAARLDDVVNYIPARVTGGVLVLAGAWGGRQGTGRDETRKMGVIEAVRYAFKVMMRDGGRHASPNAGWPEAAMAARLGVALGGVRRYGARVRCDAVLHSEGRQEATPADMRGGLSLMWRGVVIFGVLVAAIGVVVLKVAA